MSTKPTCERETMSNAKHIAALDMVDKTVKLNVEFRVIGAELRADESLLVVTPVTDRPVITFSANPDKAMLVSPDAVEMIDPPCGNGNMTFDYEPATPHGFSDRPYFARSFHYQYRCYTSILQRDGEYITVGDCGLQAYTDTTQTLMFDSQAGGAERDFPVDGFKVVKVWCDQTGGMCMLDYYLFENGWVATINDECAILWRSLDDAQGDAGDGHDCVTMVYFEA